VVFASDDRTAERPFGRIVVERNPRIVHEARQPLPGRRR
jgi:hypothetical protein